jgi:hypothetical protein
MSYFLRERCAVVALIVSAAVCAGAQNQTPPSRDVAFARISIPRLDQAPTLKDFEGRFNRAGADRKEGSIRSGNREVL